MNDQNSPEQNEGQDSPDPTGARRDNMSFSEALDLLKRGAKICRDGWNGKGMWIHLQVPDENSKMTLPYIYMKTVDEKLVPWLASQTDILAEDWMEA